MQISGMTTSPPQFAKDPSTLLKPDLEYLAKLILSQSNAELKDQLQGVEKFLNHENLSTLWGVAWSVKNKEARKYLESLNKHLKSICRIKLLAHRLSLEGRTQYEGYSFNLTGLNDKIALRALHHSLEAHLTIPEKTEILDVFKRNLDYRTELCPQIRAEQIYAQYNEGLTVLIPLLYDLKNGLAHYFGILLKGKYLIKLNQGIKETLPSGLHVYTISDPSRVTCEFIKTMLTSSISLNYFENGLDEELGLVPITSIITRSLNANICAWSLAKLAFRGTLILEKTENSTYQEGKIFKAWKQQDSAKEVRHYLRDKNRDKQLVTSLWCKSRNPLLSKGELAGHVTTYSIADDNSTALLLAVRSNNLDAVQQLIKGGFNVNSTFSSDEKTLLIEASVQGHAKMVQHLLNLGANIDQLDKNKKSAYCHVLIKRHLSSDNPKLQEKLTEVANVLGNNGANKNASKYLMFLQGR